MNKIIKFMMAFAAAAFMFAACDKPEPDPTPDPNDKPNNEQPNDKPNEDPNDKPNEEPAGPSWCDYLFEVNFTIDETAGYGFGEFYYDQITTADGKYIHEVLGFADWAELAEAIGLKEEAIAFDRETQLFGIDLGSESDIYEGYNTNGFGYWVDANGVKDAWGSETVRCYTEAYGNEETGYLDPYCVVGVMPGNTAEGDLYKFGMVFQRTADEVVRAGVQVTIKVEAFQDPEAPLYDAANRKVGETVVEVAETMSIAQYPDYAGITVDLTKVQEALQLTKYQINEALSDGCVYGDSGELYTGLEIVAMVDGAVVEATTGGFAGCWLSAEGEVVSYLAPNSVMCIELQQGATAFNGHVCFQPENINADVEFKDAEGNVTGMSTTAVKDAVGKTVNYCNRITYIPSDDNGVATGAATVVYVNYAITIAD